MPSIYVNAAFRSSLKDQAYVFVKNRYVKIDYAPGTTDDKKLYGPSYIGDGFPSLKDTIFGENGIDCAFGSSSGTNEAFIFSGNLCALIDYAPGTSNDRIIRGPDTITEMFPFLKDTVFESGIDAAFESTVDYTAYIFKGNHSARINYIGSGSIASYPIASEFGSLKDTIFESGVDAAFASHLFNEAYIFKGDSYARFYFAPGTSGDHIIGDVRKIRPSWPSLHGILPN